MEQPPEETVLAAMATQPALTASVWRPGSVRLDTRCISPQLVILLQPAGEHENGMTLFSGEEPAPQFQTQLALFKSSVEQRERVRLGCLSLVWTEPGQQPVKAPLHAGYLPLNKSAASNQTQRAETKRKSGSVEAKGGCSNRCRNMGGETHWDRLRRHICVRTTCHSGQWLWQKAMRSAKWGGQIP